MNTLLKTIILIIILTFYSYKNKINEPVKKPKHLYKVKGFITHNNLPLPSTNITLHTLNYIYDSTTYFLFDNIKSHQSKIVIIHPQFNNIYSLININKHITLSFISNFFIDGFRNIMITSSNVIQEATIHYPLLVTLPYISYSTV